MILQALHAYYERKQGTGELAPEGFERKEIPFVLVIDANGHLVQVDDTRSMQGKKAVARAFLVPQAVKRAAGVVSNLLWDNAEYVLGLERKHDDPEDADPGQVIERHTAFRNRLDELDADGDAGLVAVRRFLSALDLAAIQADALGAEIASENPNLTFRLAEDPPDRLVCQRPAVVEAIRAAQASGESQTGLCLVTGSQDKIARLHAAIKGVRGGQSTGSNIVSFNLPAFSSFGKSQGVNAPIGQHAAFCYTTALNHLLRKGSPQRVQVGDASTVFWATRDSAFEDSFAAFFGLPDADDPDRGVNAVRNLLESIRSGVGEADEGDARFCVLGLAPNAARIAIRFWYAAPVRDVARNIGQHFLDIAIDRPARESGYLSLFRLLNSIALLGKADNVPPDLAGDTMRAILERLPYPEMLLQAAVRRSRAERRVDYPRAAIIKACLNRLIRSVQLQARELTVSLDPTNNDAGYRLGRLFSVLERIQNAAQPGINATIRDRYYGAASSSPASVFPVLLRLKNHHLAKLQRPGLVVWYEKLLGDVMDGIASFPSQLGLREQGLFAIGYYHQQQSFFAGRPKDEGPSESDPSTPENSDDH